MNEGWLQEYIFLAFRLDKVVQATYGSPFVDGYWGPSSWRQQVETEVAMATADLVRHVITLSDALPAQGFALGRETYLGKQIRAMEMLARKLCGETFSLEQEASYRLDIHPTWTPEVQFEQAHALYETVVPETTGSLAERLRAYRMTFAFPQEPFDLLKDVIEQAFAEARKRTCALISLPQEETIEVQYFPEREYDAAAYYQGNYKTRIEMNLVATANWFPRLFDHKVCHEAYPGHHTECALKEQYLARQHDCIERMIDLVPTPQCVISEGVAMVAHEMIFSEGEAEQWIVEQMDRLLQREVDAKILLRLRQASEMLQGVWGNALMLLGEGRSEAEVAQYFVRYMLLSNDAASQYVASLKHPLRGIYALTYANGKNLMRPWLQGPDKVAVFWRFLTEQWTPSQLLEKSAQS